MSFINYITRNQVHDQKSNNLLDHQYCTVHPPKLLAPNIPSERERELKKKKKKKKNLLEYWMHMQNFGLDKPTTI